MEKGRLIIVATPIGNMGDITKRAVESLVSCDLVASEDTRKTGMLLKSLGIQKSQMSFHSFNEAASSVRIAEELSKGRDVALVSDAGTPGISDPGFSLVRLLAEKGYEVTMAPGPTAFVMALVLSGLPTASFLFRGFPPRTGSRRRTFFSDDASVPHTLVYYESPHRLKASLADMLARFGERRAALANDLTKKFEQVSRGTLSELMAGIPDDGQVLGEYVVVVEGMIEPARKRRKGNKYKPEVTREDEGR